MKTLSLACIGILFISFQKGFAQSRYWVGQSTYQNNFTTTTELNQWSVVEDDGAGSWSLSGNGSAILKMDDAAGGYANRLFNVSGGSPNRLPLDQVNGIVEFQVTALTGGNQRFFLQVQEFKADNTYLAQQNILAAQNTTGYFSVSLSSLTWNPLTTQIRFIIGGENYSSQQGTVEFSYFNYTNSNKNWSNTANWSTSSGSSGGASAPGVSNTAIFDGGSGKNGICFLNTATSVADIQISSAYTGVLDLRGNNLTASGNVTLATGEITNSASSASLILSNANATLSGTIFTVPITGTADQLFLNGSIFNNAVTLTKTGLGLNNSTGGNTFNATASITTNNALGGVRMANTTGDVFNGDAVFSNTLGTLQPAYNGTSLFYGNITTTSTFLTPIDFGAGTGITTFSGSKAQTFTNAGSNTSIQRLVMNKSASTLTLNSPVNIETSATFTAGIINTTLTNLLSFDNGSTASGASNTSHVDGPVKKTGNSSFIFPTGNKGIYRSIGISAPLFTTDAFTAQFFKATQGFGLVKDVTLITASTCEYWTLTGSSISNVFVTLSWNSANCSATYVTDPTTLRVAHWNNTKWENYGRTSSTGNAASGTITASVGATTFSPLLLASTSSSNALPIELGKFWSVNQPSAVDLYWTTLTEENNDYFTLQRSFNGTDFIPLDTVRGAGNSLTVTQYKYSDEAPVSGYSYYRLKQTDYDGKSTYSPILVVNRSVKNESSFAAYPNPSSDGKIKLNQKTNVIVINNLNQVVIKALQVDNIDLSALPQGIYNIVNDAGQSTRVVRQ